MILVINHQSSEISDKGC